MPSTCGRLPGDLAVTQDPAGVSRLIAGTTFLAVRCSASLVRLQVAHAVTPRSAGDVWAIRQILSRVCSSIVLGRPPAPFWVQGLESVLVWMTLQT